MTTNVEDSIIANEVEDAAGLESVRRSIARATELLPAQGPIEVFVHHNTLHAFEDRKFDEGVQAGARLFGCHAHLPEDRYRRELQRGRIRVADLETVLLVDLGDEADRLVANFGTRYALRLAMLQFPLRTGGTAELRWTVAETDALRRFRTEVDSSVRERMIEDTRNWILQELRSGELGTRRSTEDYLGDLFQQFDKGSMDSWSDTTWEAFILNFLWRVCSDRIRQLEYAPSGAAPNDAIQSQIKTIRFRDLLLEVTGEDTDELVHEPLIRLCSAFLDQGFADWSMPGRSQGLYAIFLQLYAAPFGAPTRWLRELQREARRLTDHHIEPLESIQESLMLLGVDQAGQEECICQALLALRGWAGMVWQMETNAEWAPHPAPPGSLLNFLAVRLVLDRLAARHVASSSLRFNGPLPQLRDKLRQRITPRRERSPDQRAFTVFQLAQVRGWKPEDLQILSQEQWATLVEEIEAFSSLERRRVYHLAFERKYRNATFDAISAHAKRISSHLVPDPTALIAEPTAFQVICCIDEREESFRRHLEEVAPECETFGFAGFFGVAMYYRGVADAHFTPLCPVNVKPQHYVTEEPLYSLVEAERRRAETRRRIGRVTHRAHLGTRTFLGGLLAGLLGSLAAFPLVARILFPRTTSHIRRLLGSIVQTPSTELRLERTEAEPGADNGHIGYVVEEMAQTVEGALRAIGMSRPELFSPLIVICGHGSSSLNNPHEAAHDCGACGGGRGGPNARAFSQMANDPRVRHLLADPRVVHPRRNLFCWWLP